MPGVRRGGGGGGAKDGASCVSAFVEVGKTSGLKLEKLDWRRRALAEFCSGTGIESKKLEWLLEEL